MTGVQTCALPIWSGGWWAARLALCVVLAVWAVVLRGTSLRVVALTAPVAAVGLALVTALGGHAATGRWVIVGVVATVAHLVAVGVWGAGLVSLAAGRTVQARAFSPVALVAAAVAAISGVLNGARQVGAVDLLWSTRYRRTLVVKVALVLVLVGLAAVSRRRVRSGSEVRDVSDGSPAPVNPGLVRSVRAEVMVVVAVLAVTSVLVAARPSIGERAVAVEASAVVGDRVAQVVLDPGRAGGASLHVYLTSPRGALDRAEDIAVSATLAAEDLGPLSLAVFDAGPNHVTNQIGRAHV